ncbi:DUF5946 family protein [Allonocardiopsis opalescens]|uniref:Uncharacterized protein n=1 Tax=Allonocardiopsis opalescens TaxID=1144618 RepID=A0A2T0PVC6_9ACTN|nr:DUF5946 family protein [Allonocardiopsis opalescens]PRX95482.1 hypothetical protein CLV72_10990 [Allonocardiopsis opalescens]
MTPDDGVRCGTCAAFVPSRRSARKDATSAAAGRGPAAATPAPACWRAYVRLLARGYRDADYASAQRLTVDAYVCQHPHGTPMASAEQVTVHLMALCQVLERELSPVAATRWMVAHRRSGAPLEALAAPQLSGTLTVEHPLSAADAEAHHAAVRAWAWSVWDAWKAHHATIRALLDR